jgi:hypothetical protein
MSRNKLRCVNCVAPTEGTVVWGLADIQFELLLGAFAGLITGEAVGSR